VVGCAGVAMLVDKLVQPDALALLFGAVAGFLVSLPVGVLGFLLLARQVRPRREEEREERAAPPVVVIAPGAVLPTWGQPEAPPPQGTPSAPQGRRFVVGDWD
ncbi:MAG: hypothetical protein ACUVS5_06560, partial [Anaerolineae bacterium]